MTEALKLCEGPAIGRGEMAPEEAMRRLQDVLSDSVELLSTSPIEEEVFRHAVGHLLFALTGKRAKHRRPSEHAPAPEADHGFRDIIPLQTNVSTYRKQLLARGDCRCAFCGKRLTKENSTIDHLIPQAKGGTNAPANLVLACQPCNNTKGNRTPEEWSADILASTKGGAR